MTEREKAATRQRIAGRKSGETMRPEVGGFSAAVCGVKCPSFFLVGLRLLRIDSQRDTMVSRGSLRDARHQRDGGQDFVCPGSLHLAIYEHLQVEPANPCRAAKLRRRLTTQSSTTHTHGRWDPTFPPDHWQGEPSEEHCRNERDATAGNGERRQQTDPKQATRTSRRSESAAVAPRSVSHPYLSPELSPI